MAGFEFISEVFDEMDKEVEELEAKGHPPHCAARQVYGDGECECGLYEKGYDPNAWQKEKR